MEESQRARLDESEGVIMPTYSFRDKNTGQEFDAFISIS